MKNKLKSLLCSIPLILSISGIGYAQQEYGDSKEFSRFCDCVQIKDYLVLVDGYLSQLEKVRESSLEGLEEEPNNPSKKVNLGAALILEKDLIERRNKSLDTEEECGCYGRKL
jgi:hypothetical protein